MRAAAAPWRCGRGITRWVRVSGATVSAATAWHKSLGKLMVIALVLGHVTAIVWYHWRKRQALVRAMLSGDKTLPEAHPSSRDTWALRVFALFLVLLCAAAVRWLVALGTA